MDANTPLQKKLQNLIMDANIGGPNFQDIVFIFDITCTAEKIWTESNFCFGIVIAGCKDCHSHSASREATFAIPQILN